MNLVSWWEPTFAPLKLRDYADLCLPRLHKGQITSRCGSRIIAAASLTSTAMTQDLAMSTSSLPATALSPYSLRPTRPAPARRIMCSHTSQAQSKQSHIINASTWRSHIIVGFVQLLNEWPAAQVSPQRKNTVSEWVSEWTSCKTGWPITAASWINLHIT